MPGPSSAGSMRASSDAKALCRLYAEQLCFVCSVGRVVCVWCVCVLRCVLMFSAAYWRVRRAPSCPQVTLRRPCWTSQAQSVKPIPAQVAIKTENDATIRKKKVSATNE